MRIITGSPPHSHADPLFFQLGVLKVDDLFDQSVRMFAFKAYKNSLPDGMQGLFDRTNVSHNYNTRGAERNFFLRGNPRSIKYLVPSRWNSLPVHLKGKLTVSSFKNRNTWPSTRLSDALCVTATPAYVAQLHEVLPACLPTFLVDLHLLVVGYCSMVFVRLRSLFVICIACCLSFGAHHLLAFGISCCLCLFNCVVTSPVC